MSYASQAQCLIATGVAVSLTGTTTKTALYTATIKGGTMGLNDYLRFTSLFTYTNSANNKTPSININGTIIFSINVTTTVLNNRIVYWVNRNSLSSQVLTGTTTNGTFGGVGITTTAINTANDMTITWSGTLANSGETITLERGSCEIWRFPV